MLARVFCGIFTGAATLLGIIAAVFGLDDDSKLPLLTALVCGLLAAAGCVLLVLLARLP